MVNTVNANELTALLASQHIDLIDVRDPSELAASGYIAGSRNIPLDDFRADPDKLLSHDSTIVFVCAKGVRSLAAAKLAERLGYEHIYNLDGGTKEWSRLGLPLELVATRAAA
jgi:rhodanese-related sulfurtransferase